MLGEEKRAFAILSVDHSVRKPKKVRTQERNFAALSVRCRGNARFQWQGGSLSVGDGALLYLPSALSFERESGEEELIAIRLAVYGEDEKAPVHLPNGLMTLRLFQEILTLWEEDRRENYHLCMSKLYSIFEMARLEEKKEAPPLPKPLELGLAVMKRHFRESDFRIEAAAEAAFVSQVYFRRLYKRHFGKTPWQGLMEMRFAYASSLLSLKYYSVREAALRSGFADEKYFRTAFTKQFGVSPTQWRDGKES